MQQIIFSIRFGPKEFTFLRLWFHYAVFSCDVSSNKNFLLLQMFPLEMIGGVVDL